MDHMKPEKTNVILLTKKDSHLCTEEEKWYGTKYCVTGKKCSSRSMNIWISALQNVINQVLHVFYLDWFFFSSWYLIKNVHCFIWEASHSPYRFCFLVQCHSNSQAMRKYGERWFTEDFVFEERKNSLITSITAV